MAAFSLESGGRGDYSQLVDLGKAISRLFGWTYFMAWSLSFYPQLIQTYRRRSVTGLSIDFFTINIVGFAVYTVSTYLFLFSSTIRKQYASHHPSAPEPSVQYNDLAFGIHALILTAIAWSQFWCFGYKREPTQKLSSGMITLIIGSAAVTTIVGSLVYLQIDEWEALDIVYTLGYIKLLITILKYIPQVYLNYKRESTVGWSIYNILLDTTGGTLSLAQLFLDSALAGDLWGGTFGNPLKLGLGLVTLGFDGIFLCQHYIWFRGKAPLELIPESDESEPNQTNYGSV